MDDSKRYGLIVAAQPTLDRTVTIDHFAAGKTYRLPSVRRLASGKALNVARSLHRMGCRILVVGLFGGFSGRWMVDQLSEIGIQVSPVWVNGENRVAYSIYDPSGDHLTELIEDDDGPVSPENWSELEHVVEEALPQANFLVLSGRASAGSPEDGYRRLVDQAVTHHVPTYIDCYGVSLKHALEGRPTVLKINSREAGYFLERKLTTMHDCLEAASTFLSQGVNTVVITLGESGAIAVDSHTAWIATPPKVHGAAIGSGDVFMAGMVYGLGQAWSLESTLRYATAAGTANVMYPGAGIFDSDDVEVIGKRIVLRKVSELDDHVKLL